MTNMNVDMRPIAERQAEVDRQLKAGLPQGAYDNFRQTASAVISAMRIVVMVLDREQWDRFWSVLRDTIESNAETTLAAKERAKNRDPGIFG